MESAQRADADMQRVQRTANGRNSGHSGTRQAQTEASANPSDTLDTACKNDKHQQPTQTQPTRPQTTNAGGVNQNLRTSGPEATPGTANSAPTAA
jgi:3-oxoacyl-(acyl-carrier-protein) synthase